MILQSDGSNGTLPKKHPRNAANSTELTNRICYQESRLEFVNPSSLLPDTIIDKLYRLLFMKEELHRLALERSSRWRAVEISRFWSISDRKN